MEEIIEKIKEKLLSNSVKVFTSIGILNLVIYYFSIDYIPIIKIEDLGILFVAITSTAIVLSILLSLYLLIPGAFFGMEPKLLEDIFLIEKKVGGIRVSILFFILPFVIFFIFSLILIFICKWNINLSILISSIIAITYLSFLIYLIEIKYVPSENKTKIKLFFTSFFSSYMLFLPTLIYITFMKTSPKESFTENSNDLLLLILGLIFTLALNIFISLKRLNKAITILILSLVCLISALYFTKNIYLIQQKTASIFKIGHFTVDNIHINKKACEYFKEMGGSCENNIIKNVFIKSRIGKEIFITTKDGEFLLDSKDITGYKFQNSKNYDAIKDKLPKEKHTDKSCEGCNEDKLTSKKDTPA